MYKTVEIFTNLFHKLDDSVYSHNFHGLCVTFLLVRKKTVFHLSDLYMRLQHKEFIKCIVFF